MDSTNTTQVMIQTPWPSALLSVFDSSGSGEQIWAWTLWKPLLLPAVIVYISLCRALRHRREQAMLRAFGYPPDADREENRAALARMTNDEAQRIIQYIASYEIPQFHVVSLEFALFKTYAIESISKLLLATRNLTDPIQSRKRFEDTALLIGEFLAYPPTSPRAVRAIARMNWLHRKYQQAGQISNGDMLYTLSVFVTEPPRFARLYEWRRLNAMERCAYGVFWKSIGDAMGIRYEGYLSRAGEWRDGLDFFDDIAAWAKDYEVRHMRPSAVAAKPARTLIPMLTYWVPGFAKPFAAECVCVLIDDRTREAFMLPEPGIVAAMIVYTTLALRRFVLMYLCLPRLFKVKFLKDEVDPATGRMSLGMSYGSFPFYIKPTLWNRWGPGAWVIWLAGGKVPGDDPDEFMPQGYSFEDVGPRNRANMGKEEMDIDAEELMKSGRGGCPFAF
ncbi:hypothetical protein SLS62_005004 [Diatrype stigma]|uniref:ER-bound oxygenase mpaB/mpaB'/Rubber oxygenase catalytic domain-containing protein n=1 Tax=Diatrype stigma TaxID=117547 RepID=A0AAN9UPV5_9PEZI